VISFQLEAMPIWGFGKSSSDMPTARSMPRAAARSRPSVTVRERGLMSGVVGVSVMRASVVAARGQYSDRSSIAMPDAPDRYAI
jgi:hypothetical protein